MTKAPHFCDMFNPKVLFLSLWLALFIKEGPCSILSEICKALNVDEKSLLESAKTFKFTNASANLRFLAFQPNNETIPVVPTNASTILKPSLPTKILVEGWNQEFPANWTLDAAYLYHKYHNYNVILVDWSVYALQEYRLAAADSQCVGFAIGDFIIELQETFPSLLRKFHVIGHSLGGQVVGFVGKRVYSMTGRKIDRITALEAAAVYFEFPNRFSEEFRIAKTDADFVDLVHTQGPLGVVLPYGQVDFYVNFAIFNPKCLLNITHFFSCGHGTSNEYFVRSIEFPKKYEGVRCGGPLELILGLCWFNRKAYMGESVSREAEGKYYLFAV